MKNEVFRFLSKEDKEHILLRVLRVRTEGLLYVKEECALLHALTQKNQFRIHAYRDINAFRRAFDIRNKTKYEVVYGEAALADSLKPNTLIGTGIAVMASLDKTPDLINQLYIYIPQIRKCKGRCVREKIICEHIVSRGGEELCCDFQNTSSEVGYEL